jgi:DNA-binding IclR family transcriptional regulator
MSSLARLLAVLDLFDEGAAVWTAEAIAERLDISLPTAYRYVRELSEAGLLRRDAGGTYVLGPRVIELDHRIRIGDPLILAGAPVMRELAADTGCDAVLATLYGERVVTIHQETGGERISASFGRGRRMPLFRGMLSKLVLAALPRARLRKLWAGAGEAARAEPFARDFEAMLVELRAIRRAGYCVTHGELDAGLVGIGVSLTSAEHRIIAALGLIVGKARFAAFDEKRVAGLIGAAAGRVLAKLPAPGGAP